jgi:hypothetical protein
MDVLVPAGILPAIQKRNAGTPAAAAAAAENMTVQCKLHFHIMS